MNFKKFFEELSKSCRLYRYKRLHSEPYQPAVVARYYRPTDTPFDPNRKKAIMMIDGRVLHGGLADRIRGCLGVYALCKQHGIPFFINWVFPFDLTLFLVPNSRDWRIDPREIRYETPASLLFSAFTVGLPFGESGMDRRFILKNLLHTRHSQYHIYSNAILSRSQWPDLYHELFKPSRMLQEAIDENQTRIGAPYVSFTLRFQQLLGDFKEGNYRILEDEERQRLIDRCLEELRTLIDRIPASRRILVTSDSITFLDRAREIPRVYVIPGAVAHMNYQEESHTFLKSFVDFYLIMGAEKVHLLLTGEMYNSGFPRFAAEIGGKPYVVHRF